MASYACLQRSRQKAQLALIYSSSQQVPTGLLSLQQYPAGILPGKVVKGGPGKLEHGGMPSLDGQVA